MQLREDKVREFRKGLHKWTWNWRKLFGRGTPQEIRAQQDAATQLDSSNDILPTPKPTRVDFGRRVIFKGDVAHCS